jgi:hypothetical protein
MTESSNQSSCLQSSWCTTATTATFFPGPNSPTHLQHVQLTSPSKHAPFSPPMIQALSNFNRDLYRTLQPPLTFISDRGEGRSSDSDFAVRPVLAQDGWEPLATSHECYASQGVHNDNLLLPWNGHNCMGFLLLSRAWVVPGITKPMNQLYTTHEFPRSDKLAGYTLPQVLS